GAERATVSRARLLATARDGKRRRDRAQARLLGPGRRRAREQLFPGPRGPGAAHGRDRGARDRVIDAGLYRRLFAELAGIGHEPGSARSTPWARISTRWPTVARSTARSGWWPALSRSRLLSATGARQSRSRWGRWWTRRARVSVRPSSDRAHSRASSIARRS